MTDQEVYDTLEREFKGKALDTSTLSACRYLTLDGKKCTIGCFIPDDMYNVNMDKAGSVRSLLMLHPKLENHLPDLTIKELDTWQQFHDKKLDNTAPILEQRNALFNEYMRIKRQREE